MKNAEQRRQLLSLETSHPARSGKIADRNGADLPQLAPKSDGAPLALFQASDPSLFVVTAEKLRFEGLVQ
jgi:hypothetical protein